MSEREIFMAALDLPAAARTEYLDKVCGTDAGVRSRVEALLRSHEAAGSFLGTPAVALHDSDTATTRTIGNEGGSAADDEVPLGFLAPPTRPDSLGRIGHYEVLQVLGQGGFGIVFRAFDDVLQRVVAVKVLSPQLAATSPARKRFLREARTSAAVRHEHVVQVYEVGEAPLPYIAMEFIPGETLQQRLDRIGPIEPAEVVRIGRQIAEGLAAAHANDLIHRDIKPANVLLEGGAQKVKITDFGLARAADDASISQSGIIAGTPMYMAPEQAKGEKLDQRADLFSLGSVLYQMASGRSPFRANSTVAVLKRVAEDTPRDIREIIPETPQWLCDIIAKLHAKNPDERFQSAHEVADVLADCEAQLKANAKLKDYSRIPRCKARRSGRRKWVVATAILLLPVVACAVTESIGVTHLFRGKQVTTEPIKPDSDPLPLVKQETLPPTFKNSIGMEFVIVPKGKSWLGGGKDKLGDQEVEIPADFYMGKFEVTQEEWEKVMGENPSHFSRTGGGMDAVKDISDADLKRFPVENVSWDQCQLFVAKLNQREKETGWVYRLPTSAEWEYGCRGGPMPNRADSAFDFYFERPTNTLLPEQANFEHDKSLKRTCNVGSNDANRLGLFGMHGNVWEWCRDETPSDPKDAPAASRRLTRSGAWTHDPGWCRAAHYSTAPSSARNINMGLRLARVPSGDPSREAKTPPLAVAPFTDADVQRIAVLPAEQQIEEVRKELIRRNPGFDGKFEHKIDDGVVTVFWIVTDKVTDIAPIRVFNGLRVLACSGTYANGQLADLTPLKGMNLAGLTHLDLTDTKVTDAGMVCFKECKNLTSLALLRTQIGDAGVVHFQDCKDLKVLRLDATQVSDAGLVHFKGCQALTELWLGHTKVSDAGLANLKDCKNLTNLFLDATQVSDAGLSHFKDCKNLTALAINNTRVSDAGLAYLKGMPLRFLYMYDTSITDLTPLQGMPLEKIALTPKNITRGLDILRDLKSLKTIGLGFNQSWPAAEFWERYDKGEFTQAISPDRLAAEYVLSIGRAVKLNGEDKEIKAVADLPREPFQVTTVDLNGSKQVTDAGLVVFKDCKDLIYLDLYLTPVTDAGLAHFKDCKNLLWLKVEDTQVTDAGLANFKDCKNLMDLNLAAEKVSDAGLAHFKDCKKLMILHLEKTQVTDAGLDQLKECKDLTTLTLQKTKVTAKGVEDLAKALPNCKIEWDGGVIEPK